MQIIIIFFIIFFMILVLAYPLIRIVYFFSSKKTVQNKILNLCIMIISFIIIYFIIRGQISNLMKIDLGEYINSKKQLMLIVVTVFFGNFIETILNCIINFFIKRRMKTK